MLSMSPFSADQFGDPFSHLKQREWCTGLESIVTAVDYRGCPNKPALAANASFCWM